MAKIFGHWRQKYLDNVALKLFRQCCPKNIWTLMGKNIWQNGLKSKGHTILGSAKFASKLNSKMNTPESCSFWVTDTGNISFSTEIHCFNQVLASWLSSISLLEMKNFLLTTPPCCTSKVASRHVDCRYELNFCSYLGKILSKSPKTGKIWHYCSNHGSQDLMKTVDLSGKTYISSISDPKGTAFRGIHLQIQFWCKFGTP